MGKKRQLLLLLLLLAVLFLVACSEEKKEDNNTTSQGDVQEEPMPEQTSPEGNGESEMTEQQAVPQVQEPQMNLAVADAYQTMLENCTREFIGGYPIDEAFCGWLTGNFGEEVIFAIADAVQASQPNVDLWYEKTGNSIHVLWSMYCKETGIQAYSLERVYWKECANAEQTVIDFVGDVNFSEDWSTTIHMDKQVDGLYDCLSKEVLTELNQADILMVNNEFTYSTGGTPLEGKDYVFRARPDRVYLLEIMGADIVSLANNHAYDYGPEALLDTMATLKEAGVPYVGAGANLKEAMEPSYFIANGKKIAIVSATQIERSLNYTKEATETTPGVLKTLDPDKFVTVIQEAGTKADYVIVYVHWGTEQNAYYGSDQVELADAFIEAGADVIIGGHTHCLQGCEYRDGVPIIYSLGNFWFNSNKLDTGISQVIIRKDGGIDFRFIPCIQSKNETYMPEASERQRILDYLETLSYGVAIDENGYIIENN